MQTLNSRPEESTALIVDRSQYTVAEVLVFAKRLQDLLSDALVKIKKETRPLDACFVLPSLNPVSYMIGFVACLNAGVGVIPWREQAISLDRLMNLVRPDGLIKITDAPGTGFSLELFDQPELEFSRPGQVVMLTSGSTGQPKGVTLGVAQLIRNAELAGSAINLSACSKWAIDIDMALMSATSHMVMAWQYDKPLLHLLDMPNDSSDREFSDGCTGFGGSPIQLVRMSERLGAKTQPNKMMSSGDFLAPAMLDQIRTSFPNTEIYKFYGLTELSGRFCFVSNQELFKYKSAAGRPLPGFEVRIACENEEGGIGEIEAKSDLITAGYYVGDGQFQAIEGDWFSTGDIGSLENGMLTLIGRSDDVMKVGGEKVDRQTIESALTEILYQHEYCVLSVQHSLFGQCPALFIAENSAYNIPAWDEIVQAMKKKLSSRFIPSLIFRLEEGLPRLANGKIDRVKLKTEFQQYPRLH